MILTRPVPANAPAMGHRSIALTTRSGLEGPNRDGGLTEWIETLIIME